MEVFLRIRIGDTLLTDRANLTIPNTSEYILNFPLDGSIEGLIRALGDKITDLKQKQIIPKDAQLEDVTALTKGTVFSSGTVSNILKLTGTINSVLQLEPGKRFIIDVKLSQISPTQGGRKRKTRKNKNKRV